MLWFIFILKLIFVKISNLKNIIHFYESLKIIQLWNKLKGEIINELTNFKACLHIEGNIYQNILFGWNPKECSDVLMKDAFLLNVNQGVLRFNRQRCSHSPLLVRLRSQIHQNICKILGSSILFVESQVYSHLFTCVQIKRGGVQIKEILQFIEPGLSSSYMGLYIYKTITLF